MSTENSTPTRPSFGRRLWLALKSLAIFLFKVLLTLLIVAAVGAAIYFGAPVLIDEYLLKDVEVNSSKIELLETDLENNSEFINQRLEDLQTRVHTLEIQGDTDEEMIANLQTQLSAAESLLLDVENSLLDQGAALENLGALSAMLDEQAASISTLDERVTAYEASLNDVQEVVLVLAESGVTQQGEIEELKTQQEAKDTLGTLHLDLSLLKVMGLITRAQVSIGQENIGLAKDDLGTAQELLTNLRAEATEDQVAYFDEVSQRIELAIKNLSELPDLVVEDLEVAWQLLVQGLPEDSTNLDGTTEGDEATPTPAQETGEEGVAEETPTPTPTPKP